MNHTPLLFCVAFLCAVLNGVTFGDEKTSVFEFDEASVDAWTIETEDANAYSLTDRPGELILKTAYGCANAGCRTLPRNTFFLNNSPAADADYDVTLHVSEFQPTAYWHQVTILLHQSGNSYVKFCCERSRDKGTENAVLFHANQNQRTRVDALDVEVDGPIWLRIEKRGTSYTASFSNDGDQFDPVAAADWTPDEAEAVVRIGFAAYNGRNRSAEEIDVVIESFTIVERDAE